jgi:glycosyltransferase involved in cell wall biosynthesis
VLRVEAQTAYPLMVPSARVRLASFVPWLSGHGVDLAYRPTLTEGEYLAIASEVSAARKALIAARATLRAALRRSEPGDLLLVHRLRTALPLLRVDPPARLDVYDLDDALFEGSTGAANRSFGWVKQEARRSVEAMRRARLVIAGNAYLADHARRYATTVAVVPSCVDTDAQRVREHVSREEVVVGWIGSPSTGPYLTSVIPAFEQLRADGVGMRLVVVGADTGRREPWIEHRPWSLAREREDLAGFDIGLMPTPDDPWTRGKCGYKLLQYYSAGVPAVASPVGVAAAMVRDGGSLAASSIAEWKAGVAELAADAGARRQRGGQARSYAEAHYSYRRWAPELADLLRSVA